MNPASDDSPTPDPALLKEFVSGDRESAQTAFRQLVTRYERLVWCVCRRQLNNRCDIEDAFQTTFMVLATRAKRIRKPESLATWLYGVAWKTASRMRRQRPVTPIDEDVLLTTRDESPLEIVAKRFQFESLDHSLNLLDQKYREPLVLYYFAGLNTRQIAQQLDISLAATEGRLRRGKAKLRGDLAGQGILLSPVMLAGAMMPQLEPAPELVAATCEQCFTTINGSASIGETLTDAVTQLTGSIDTGTKLMICKSAVLIAMATLLAAGGAMHLQGTPSRHQVADQIYLTADQESEASSHINLATDDEDETGHLTSAEAFHDHMWSVPHQIHTHAWHLLRWIGGDRHDHDGNHDEHDQPDTDRLHQHEHHDHEGDK